MIKNIENWIKDQRAFDTHDVTGIKIFDAFSYKFWNWEVFINNKFFLYETFENGSDWYYQDAGNKNRKMHRFNPYRANVTVKKGNKVYYSKVLDSDHKEHPDWDNGGKYGKIELNLSSAMGSESSLMGGDREKPNTLYLPETGVYTVSVDYGARKDTYIRPMGAGLSRLNHNDIILVRLKEDNNHELEVIEGGYKGAGVYYFDGKMRILYDYNSEQRHIIVI